MHSTLPKLLALTASLCLTSPPCPAGDAPGLLQLQSVERIWDRAPHNAFTDLIRYRDRWVCAFREAPRHEGGVKDSQIRVLVSKEAQQWQSVAELADPRGDIRDAKLAVMPDGRLMLLTAIQLFDTSEQRHQSLVWFTSDLETWQGPHDVGEPDYWLWGIAWHDGTGYTIGYSTGKSAHRTRLYTTTDGLQYNVLVPQLHAERANESSLVFDGDRATCLLRRVGPAAVGTAQAPFINWKWHALEQFVGGPKVIHLPNGRLLGGGRLQQEGGPVTALFWVKADPEHASIDVALRLPSGGDTSYPGMVWHNDELYISYYSSHEQRTSIYLARVTVEPKPAQ